MSNEPSNGNEQHEVAPYLLHPLLRDLALNDGDESESAARITNVEYHDGNLYVGTSSAEIIHYVSIPPEANDPAGAPTLIQASRRQVDYQESTSTGNGVEKILVVPNAGKACILCNGTLTFYSLPELSPAYNGDVRILRCLYVSGNESASSDEDQTAAIEVISCDQNRIRIIQLTDGPKPKAPKSIGLPGCSALARRGTIACIADSKSYSLLELSESGHIPLFEISPQSDTDASPSERALPDLPTESATSEAPAEAGADAPQPKSASSAAGAASPKKRSTRLNPNITTPTPLEFLITTGTSKDEEGVGIFVDLDGEVVRGTLQFSKYPRSMIVDGAGTSPSNETLASDGQDEGYVLAVVPRGVGHAIEVQRWDLDPSQDNRKYYVYGPSKSTGDSGPQTAISLDLRQAGSATSLTLPAVLEKLALRKARPSRKESTGDEESDKSRERSEVQFVKQLASLSAHILTWSETSIYWTLRTPRVIGLDQRLEDALQSTTAGICINRAAVEGVLVGLRELEPKNELDFLTFKLIKQKASLLLFLDLSTKASMGENIPTRDQSVTAEALKDGDLDPRIVLTAVPTVRHEIFGLATLWMQGGLAKVLDLYTERTKVVDDVDLSSPVGSSVFPLVKDFLAHWRKKKGFGSVEDEAEVFRSVDGALLHLLLLLDTQTPPGTKTAIRGELHSLVDGGIDCFERGIELCEQHDRLYVLSRLYQSKRQSDKVLHTWKRIIEDEHDPCGEFGDAEAKMKSYLIHRNRSLIEEYGSWLAQRNPALGVQVFADPSSNARLQPKEVVALLKQRAPNAVKSFLEHLVFGNGLPQYANDLVGYYLDSVVAELERSGESRQALLDSYENYRTLTPPKPSYSQFITSNGIDRDWWRNRLRLLQLLGGSHGAASQYDIEGISARIEAFSRFLVPETIILSGRQGKHRVAIQMLTHHLGDFDTAIRYCLLGGSSTYSPLSGHEHAEALPERQAQVGLFRCLLDEFLQIEDPDDRMSQTSELLARFAGWFELEEVLKTIPEDWSVGQLCSFLERSFRDLVTERHEAVIMRALVTTANLTANAQLVEKVVSLGPVIGTATAQEQ